MFQFIDDEPVIISTNDPFEEMFVGEKQAAVGENLNELTVPDDKTGKAKELDQRTKRGKSNEVEIKRETNRGVRHFLYRGIPIDDGIGFGVYIDITQRKRKKEYIQVLQRILRHNFRNDISVIKGFASRADELSTDEEISKCISRVLDKATQIEKLTDEAGTIRDIIEEDFDPETQTVAVEDVADSAIESCISDFNNANVGIDCTDDLTVKAGSKLRVVFESLIDNGLRYNDSDQPKVMVRGHQTGGNRAHITIADNGVGISSTERKIITGEKETSPLEHGSGLGLWVAKWVIESYQGTIDIHTHPNGGTLVEFWLSC